MIVADRAHLIRAALERLAAATDDLLDLTPADVGTAKARTVLCEADEALATARMTVALTPEAAFV